jgi:MFS family permease
LSNKQRARDEITSPFRSRGFPTYYLGQSISFFGDGIVPLTFAFAALEVSRSGWGMPIILLSLWGARMLFIGPGGSISDRYNRVAVMLIADVVRLIAQVVPIIAFVSGTATLWHLGVSAALYGVATSFYVPASIGLIPQLVPDGALQKANSWIDVTLNTGLLVGPALATLLVTLGGVPLALLVDVATFAVSIVCLTALWRLRGLAAWHQDDDSSQASVDDDLSTDEAADGGFWQGIAVLRRHPDILTMILLRCPVQLSIAAISVLGPIVARDSLGGIAFWAALATALATGGLVGSVAAGWVRLSRPKYFVVWTLMVCQPVQLVLFAFGINIVALTIAFAVTAVLISMEGVIFDTYLQKTVPNSALSRIGSVEQTLISVMVPVGLAISLPLAKVLGTQTYLLGLAALIVASAIAASCSMQLRREPAMKGS